MARRVAGVTRARIDAAALALFRGRGYEATALREIASALGVTRAALYYHVPSKAGLLHRLADPFLDALESLVASHGDAEPDAAGRRTLLRQALDVFLAHQSVVTWLLCDVSARAQSGIDERLQAQLGRLHKLLVGDSADVTRQARAAAAVGALLQPFTILDGYDLGELRDTLVAASLDALGTG